MPDSLDIAYLDVLQARVSFADSAKEISSSHGEGGPHDLQRNRTVSRLRIRLQKWSPCPATIYAYTVWQCTNLHSHMRNEALMSISIYYHYAE